MPRRVSSLGRLENLDKPGTPADQLDDHAIKPDAPVKPKARQTKQEIALTAVERYNRVVAAADLDTIRIVAAEFRAAPAAHETLATLDGEAAIAHVSHHVHDFTLDTEGGIGACGISFQLRVSAENAKDDDLIRVNCDFEVLYRGLEGQDVYSVQRYIQRVGLYAAYPYFRAHIGHLAFLADVIRIPVLPVLKETSLSRRSRAQAPRRA